MSASGETRGRTRSRLHGVWVGLSLGAVVLLFSAVALWGGFVLGARSVGADLVQVFQRERDTLTAELAVLRQQGIACERQRQIEQERDRSTQDQLRALQDERLAMMKEVSSLRRLLRSGGRGAVTVPALHLAAADAPREYRYRFTVSQLVDGVGETSGKIDIKVSGKQDGADRTLSLKQLAGSKPAKLSMRFDHFQTFEGLLVLPSGFEPQALILEVEPQGDKLIASQETFPWRLGE